MPQSPGTSVVGEFGCVAIHANLCTCMWGPEVNSGCCSSGAVFLNIFSSQDLFYFYVFVCGYECMYVCGSECTYVCVCALLENPKGAPSGTLRTGEGIEFPGACYRWFVSHLIMGTRN